MEEGDELMLIIDEIIHILNNIMREHIPSTDNVEKIQNFVNGLQEYMKGKVK